MRARHLVHLETLLHRKPTVGLPLWRKFCRVETEDLVLVLATQQAHGRMIAINDAVLVENQMSIRGIFEKNPEFLIRPFSFRHLVFERTAQCREFSPLR